MAPPAQTLLLRMLQYFIPIQQSKMFCYYCCKYIVIIMTITIISIIFVIIIVIVIYLFN